MVKKPLHIGQKASDAQPPPTLLYSQHFNQNPAARALPLLPHAPAQSRKPNSSFKRLVDSTGCTPPPKSRATALNVRWTSARTTALGHCSVTSACGQTACTAALQPKRHSPPTITRGLGAACSRPARASPSRRPDTQPSPSQFAPISNGLGRFAAGKVTANYAEIAFDFERSKARARGGGVSSSNWLTATGLAGPVGLRGFTGRGPRITASSAFFGCVVTWLRPTEAQVTSQATLVTSQARAVTSQARAVTSHSGHVTG
eukprot:3574461-Rhodomonas_salina.5